MQAMIVWFFLNTATAAYCTPPESLDTAQHRLSDPGGLFDQWKAKKEPGLTPPAVMQENHPNYSVARSTCKVR